MRVVIDLQALQSEGSLYRGIGRYTWELVSAFFRQAHYDHDIHIILNAALPNYVLKLRNTLTKYIPLENIHVFSIPTPVRGLSTRFAWRRAAAEKIRETFILDLKPDCLWIPSVFEGLTDDIVISLDNPLLANITAVTIYDLIPLVLAKQYLSNINVSDWYYRKLQVIKNAQIGLAISDYSRLEAIKLLGLDDSKVFTIYPSVSAKFHCQDINDDSWYKFKERFRINRSFILYNGGAETRKNILRLIEAYALLNIETRMQFQLVIAGHLQPWQEQQILETRQRLNLFVDDITITGFVTDEELIILYSKASLFIFPSLYEGFGLPILEAMACGCVTIAANNTSMPEVIGCDEALFNAESTADIASKIKKGLFDSEFRKTLRNQNKEQVKKFSWDSSAKKILDILNKEFGSKKSNCLIIDKRRLAFICSFSSDNSSVISSLQWLLPALSKFYLIEIVTNNKEIINKDSKWMGIFISIRDFNWFVRNNRYYDRKIYIFDYQIDASINSIFNRYPGLLLLLDINYSVQLDNSFGVLLWENLPINIHSNYKYVLPVKTGSDYSLCATLEVALHYYNVIEECYKNNPVKNEQELLIDIFNLSAYNWSAARNWYQFIKMLSSKQQELLDYLHISEEWTAKKRWQFALLDSHVKVPPTKQDWTNVVRCITENKPRTFTTKNIFYDVSAFAFKNEGTGVHRVTKKYLKGLIENPPLNFSIVPVYGKDGYFYSLGYDRESNELAKPQKTDTIIDIYPNDIYLCVDMELRTPSMMKYTLQHAKVRGAKIYFLIHDILIFQLPEEYFDDFVKKHFKEWIKTVLSIADGILCTTKSVLNQLKVWLSNNPVERTDKINFGYCYLGSDIQENNENYLNINEENLSIDLKGKIIFLMVGTLEPRKGHWQTLRGFEQVWKRENSENICLIIVGKHGWKMDDFIEYIKNHCEYGRRLYWFDFISDDLLKYLYNTSAALIFSSEGEGFGLPLIEAAQYNLPLILRDLPVFRELAGNNAFYFSGKYPENISSAILEWLALFEENKAPQSRNIKWKSWRESTECLKKFLGVS